MVGSHTHVGSLPPPRESVRWAELKVGLLIETDLASRYQPWDASVRATRPAWEPPEPDPGTVGRVPVVPGQEAPGQAVPRS